jgi:dihydrofolate synthase/folylpolyglutamate synthase
MNYQETLKYLYECVPMFQRVGGGAYKAGLDTTLLLDAHFGHPHRSFRSIHIAGTNGKGSCSHTLAAIFQAAGYTVGLYTSPHLTDFRERIRVNGVPVPEQYVVDFVTDERSFYEPLAPSFFELTTAMAFRYFADRKVDLAIVEVGLGGRLDCTNIIRPELSVITNISLDHTQFLGNTLAAIATEKAGIIKQGVPIVIGETTPETRPVFLRKAEEMQAPLFWAEEETLPSPLPEYELKGLYQEKNLRTILTVLNHWHSPLFPVTKEAVSEGLLHVCELTGLRGRWQRLQTHPTLVCDTGHNVGGIRYIVEQLRREHYRRLHIIIGMVNDKDIRGVLALLPREATYYFTRASVPRALPAEELATLARTFGLQGASYPTVHRAVAAALEQAEADDFIFVGGSSFIVADLLSEGEINS